MTTLTMLQRAKRKDPTRTTTLRNQYMAEMKRRFFHIRRLVTQAIYKNDALGLKEPEFPHFNSTPVSNQAPGRQAWRFQTDAEKLTSFQTWLTGEMSGPNGPLELVDGDIWSAKYVDSSYRKGVVRAYTDARKEVLAPSADFYQGSQAEFLESAFTQPERLSKLQFLATRSFEELKGINAVMSQQMGRILASGIANGLSPLAIAKELSANITGITKQRALTLARTEIIAAHAEGQLDSFEELGIEEVGLMAEWSTAGDDQVCPLCEPLDGAIMTVKEARGLIPRHPNCRCAWIPSRGSARSTARQRAQTPEKIKESLKAELPKTTRTGEAVPQTVEEGVRRSTWLGKEQATTNKRCEHLTINKEWFINYMEAIRTYRN